jgi:hypothetical protein
MIESNMHVVLYTDREGTQLRECVLKQLLSYGFEALEGQGFKLGHSPSVAAPRELGLWRNRWHRRVRMKILLWIKRRRGTDIEANPVESFTDQFAVIKLVKIAPDLAATFIKHKNTPILSPDVEF